MSYINYEEIIGINSNKFICNDYKNGKQVFNTLKGCLLNCDEFMFSVAFITDSGVAKLKLLLRELAKKHVCGRIITTNYLFFSEPKAIRELMKMNNVEIKMFCTDTADDIGFHTKGYIFRKGDEYNAVIGSSNLTQNALTKNQEWNTQIAGKKTAIAIKDILQEYERVWKESKPMIEVLDEYEAQYEKAKKKSEEMDIESLVTNHIYQPNTMQLIFISELNKLIASGENRGLLISSTGTGKTFASAFAVRDIKGINVKRLLFITHRETILKQAEQTYKNVFGDKIKTCLYTGNNSLDKTADFVFASFSMLYRKEHREEFKKDEFDFIIIDEVHRVGENRYQDIINYFTPKFLLGMSATPDRTDGYDIYALFNHNIVYEIRLMKALESNMLTPFNYFGIQDITVDGQSICDDDYDNLERFNKLTCDERVKNIINQAEYYGYSGDRLRGLIFVHNIEEGKKLSELFNNTGKYKTIFLDGASSQELREQSIKRLEQKEYDENRLDYIFTVDIFNEGVDIPSVNQIILLRPTVSSIIFIQQLGRGLRLNYGKEYVTVLDFIGNYKNNFMITAALSKSKTSIDDIIKPVNDILPGCSTVQFDEITKEKIYASIDKAKLYSNDRIKKEYLNVKNRLGRIPTLVEFEQHSSLSAEYFLTYKKRDFSYFSFVDSIEKNLNLNETQKKLISYLSCMVCNGKRLDEINALENLIKDKKIKFNNTYLDNCILSILSGTFLTGAYSYGNDIKFLEKNADECVISSIFNENLENTKFKKCVDDLIDAGKYINNENYVPNDLALFQKYSRRDVSRFLNLKETYESTMFGYKLIRERDTMPIFVKLEKDVENDSPVNYDDYFIDETKFHWVTRHCTLDSQSIKEILSYNNLKIMLFIQKSSKINSENEKGHYYLGECEIISKENGKMISGDNIVEMVLKLKNPVRKDIYDYLQTPINFKD